MYLKTNVSELIMNMLKLLDKNRSSNGSILQALAYLCSETDFDIGFVYERDPTRVFHIKEFTGSDRKTFPDRFSISGLTAENVEHFIQNGYLFARRRAGNDPLIGHLLDLSQTDNLLLVPIVGSERKLLGVVGFVFLGENDADMKKEAEQLSFVVRVFAKYIAPRIYEDRVVYARNSLERVLDNTGIDIYVNDFETHEMLYANRSMAAPYGGMENFANKKCFEALYDGKTEECEYCPQKKLIDEDGIPSKVYSWDYQRPFDGAWFRVFSAAFRWVDGRLAHVVSSVDITENKRNEEIISHMANYDALTDLPNRRKLIQDCSGRTGSKKRGYVLFMDLDGFKRVNDNYSHRAGDELLIQIGRFFVNTEETKNIYRNGGDEFVVLYDGGDREEIIAVAKKVLQRFREPWDLSVGDVYVNTSIGISQYPADANDAEDLLQAADMAMYEAKREGPGNACFYGGREVITL